MAPKKVKTQVQKDCERRARTHPCQKCGTSCIKKVSGKFKMHLDTCPNCHASVDISYLAAPWGLTWEELQALRDRLDEVFAGRKQLNGKKLGRAVKPF